ncbi:MAG: hypothetical protein Q4A86_01655 [Clostridia bacterium]|nr:hypothetical protein [Clostridia bacterium]
MSKMKATIRNGRTTNAGRVFNANHNTRQETRAVEGHIDHDRTAQNLNFKFLADGSIEKCDSFDSRDFEISQYEIYYGEGQEAKNQRYKAEAHADRCKTVAEVYATPKTAPLETILQLGNMNTDIAPEERERILTVSAFQLIDGLRAKYGENLKILSLSIHKDEAVIHGHCRFTIMGLDRFGYSVPNQNQGFKEMGIERPNPDKPLSRYNNPLMTFSEELRETFYALCEKNGGIEIDREVKNPSQKHRDILVYKCEQLQKNVAELTAERNTLRDQNNITKTIQASFDEVEIDIEAEAVPERTHRGQVVEAEKVKIKKTDFEWLKERAKLTIGIKTAFDKLQRYGKQLWQEVSRDKIVSDLTERAETAERKAREKEATAKRLTENLDRAYTELETQQDFMKRIGIWKRFCDYVKEKFRERQEAEISRDR